MNGEEADNNMGRNSLTHRNSFDSVLPISKREDGN